MTSANDENQGTADVGGPNIPLAITALALIAWGICWYTELRFFSLLVQVVVISLIIWQACDPFSEAAQWIGKALRLPGSVRGAVLDAVASSMPELFIAIFFVLIALLGSADATLQEIGVELGKGYGSSVATCVGSAIYNMILIPAFCTLVISFTRPERPTIDVQREVISRDGMWYLGAQAVLIAFLLQGAMYWWMAFVLLTLYIVYAVQLYRDAILHRRAHRAIEAHLRTAPDDASTEQIVEALQAGGVAASPILVDEIRRNKLPDEELAADLKAGDTATLCYGLIKVPLNFTSAWLVLAGATAVAGAVCYWLVEVTHATADYLQAPVFFVAVILTAAASSVPDTFLSIGAALRGDDDGAVSNALGSNTFNICVGLAFPLFVNALARGGEPIYMSQDGTPGGPRLAGLVDLQTLMAGLTVVTLLMMWHNRQLTRWKAAALCLLYMLFVGYAVAGSLNYDLRRMLSTFVGLAG